MEWTIFHRFGLAGTNGHQFIKRRNPNVEIRITDRFEVERVVLARTHALPLRQSSYQLWTISYPPSSRRRGTTAKVFASRQADRSALTGAAPELVEASASANTSPYMGLMLP